MIVSSATSEVQTDRGWPPRFEDGPLKSRTAPSIEDGLFDRFIRMIGETLSLKLPLP